MLASDSPTPDAARVIDCVADVVAWSSRSTDASMRLPAAAMLRSRFSAASRAI
jgi:hypothetical protein